MIKITLEYATIDEAITAMAKLRGADSKPEAAKSEAKTAGKSDGAKATKPEAASAPPAPTASDKKADAPSTPTSESASQVGYGIVADKIATTAKSHRAEVVALLKKFGVESGKGLKVDQYAAFVAEIDEIAKPADDLA